MHSASPALWKKSEVFNPSAVSWEVVCGGEKAMEGSLLALFLDSALGISSDWLILVCILSLYHLRIQI